MKTNKEIKENIIKIIVGSFILSMMLCSIFYFNITNIKEINILNFNSITINDDYVYDILIKKDNNYYVVDGFIYKKNINIKTSAINLVLKDNNDKFYKMPTYITYIDEKSESLDNSSVGWAGFKSKFNEKKLENEYDIFLLVTINGSSELIKMNKKLNKK